MNQPFDIPAIHHECKAEWDHFFVDNDGAEFPDERVIVESVRGSDRRSSRLAALRELGAERDEVERGEQFVDDEDDEGMIELLNQVAAQVAADLNENMPEEYHEFSFKYEWHDSMLHLTFGKQKDEGVIDAEVVGEDAEDGEVNDSNPHE